MTDHFGQMTDDEINDLIHKIAKPTFNFFTKRLLKEIKDASKEKQITLNGFLSASLTALASHNANLLRWLENYAKLASGKEVNFYQLKMSYLQKLEENLKKLLQ